MGYIGNTPAEKYITLSKQTFTPDSSTVAFTLDNPVANENELALFVNNVRQEPGSGRAYTATGTTLTMSEAPTSGHAMYAIYLGKTMATNTPADGSVTGDMMSYPLTTFSSTGIDDNATSTAITINSSEQVEFTAGTVSLPSISTTGDVNTGIFFPAADTIAFAEGGTEAMRIDSSGHFLFAKTSTSSSVAGIRFAGDSAGYAEFTRDGGNPLYLNRETNDGDIIRFAKDDTTVGIIGSLLGTSMYVNAPNDGGAGLLFSDNADVIYPTQRVSGTVGLSDDVIDLGALVHRFDNIYATNGTIQTSDQNEKQSIQSLTASEIAVAQRISKLFKTFKFNNAVDKKGDSARTHTGIIAQDVQQAFVDEGLDASNYALFISDTWWEKEISVDAVAEELDEEGNVLVEGKDAYTYIDTKEEATEGYTERTRLGIRYPELLSFVSSAFEQRLTNIETRLTALENI